MSSQEAAAGSCSDQPFEFFGNAKEIQRSLRYY